MERVPHRGEIWRKNDPRFERYVRILEVNGDRVRIITVDKTTRMPPHSKQRPSSASLGRFGGYARGKYSFVEGPISPGRA